MQDTGKLRIDMFEQVYLSPYIFSYNFTSIRVHTKPGLAYPMAYPKCCNFTNHKGKTSNVPTEQAFKSRERSGDGRHVFK